MSLLFKFKKGKMLKLMVLVSLISLVLVSYVVKGEEITVDSKSITVKWTSGTNPKIAEDDEGKRYYSLSGVNNDAWMTEVDYANKYFYSQQKNKDNFKEFKEILEGMKYDSISAMGDVESFNQNNIDAIKEAQGWLKKKYPEYPIGTTGVDGLVGTKTLEAAKKAKSYYDTKLGGPVEEKETKPAVLTTNLKQLSKEDYTKLIDLLKEDATKLSDDEKKSLKNIAQSLGIDTTKKDADIFEATKDFLDKNVIKVSFDGQVIPVYKGEPAIYSDAEEYIFPSGVVLNTQSQEKGKGTYDEKYGVFTYTEGTSYYIVSTNTRYEVNSEGTGKRKKYYFSDPRTSLSITDLKDDKQKVYLIEDGGFYYKNNKKDTIYGVVGFRDNANNNIISLTPIEVYKIGGDGKPEDYRYTDPNYEDGKKEIVIKIGEIENRFKSSSGVLLIGIEYLEDEQGNVYIWSTTLNAWVNSDGVKVDSKEHAKSTKLAKDMAWFGLTLDEAAYITSGYRGLSMFYEEPSWWLGYDETLMNALGGIDGWTSEMCKGKISDATEYGIAMSSTTSGAFAHIEGEKIKVIDYSSETPTYDYLYKISLEVNPGPKIYGCDMKFKVYIQNPRRSVFKNSKTGLAYTFEVNKGNESVSYKGQNMVFKKSDTNYEEVCIDFIDLNGHCLVGIEEGDELCNKIVDGGEKKIDLGDDPCDAYPMMINCWSFEGEEETTERIKVTEKGGALAGDW